MLSFFADLVMQTDEDRRAFENHPVLMDAVAQAVECSQTAQRERLRRDEAQASLGRLSAREREVARLVALGHSNKEVARELAISDNTVHVHRQRITDKLGSGHAADLARLILRADPGGLEG